MTLILNGTDGLSDVDGTAATPAIRGTDTNTGIFFPAADTIAFSEGGAEVARINSDAQIVTLAGTASLPVLTFTGDTNTGIYSPAADTIGIATGGVEKFRVQSNGFQAVGEDWSATLRPAYFGRAWVNFDGTGTVAIRASGNVSSITDNGTGNYTVNFTTTFVDANYSGVFGCNDNGNTSTICYRTGGTKTTSAFQISTASGVAVLADNNMCMVAVFR